MNDDSEKRLISPKEAQEFLAKKGLKISEKETVSLLDFLYKIAKLVVDKQRHNRV